MPSNIWGHTLSREEHPKLCLLDIHLALNLYLNSIKKYVVSTNNKLGMVYAKTCEKGHFSKTTFHENLAKHLRT